MITHTVPADAFDRLAMGDGDTLGALRAGQRSKRLLLLREVFSAARSRAPEVLAKANGEESFALLTEAQRHSPSGVEDLLLQPHMGAWGMHCLTNLLTHDEVAPADIGHLGAVAASAALQAGHAFEVTTYIRDGTVMFPTFGLARLGSMQGWCRIRSRSDSGGVEVSTGDTTVAIPFKEPVGPGRAMWLPLRRLHSSARGIELDVHLDDVDPYRGCGQLRVADRLDTYAVADWQGKLDEAWRLLVEHNRHRAQTIARGVKSFVPLQPSTEAPELSATCHQAIGAVAMTPPLNVMALALALVHEFQHTKLSALLDLVPLIERSPDDLFYAPWRSDPRPLRGLFQGTYAYLGLTEFWEVHRRSDDPNGQESDDVAHFEFALWRDQVERTLGTLRRSDRLTPAGQRFVAGMEQSLSRFRVLSVPTEPSSLARMACLDHETSWRLRNLRPDPDQVAMWADKWLAGRAPPGGGHMRVAMVDGQVSMPSEGRITLLRQRLSLPPTRRDQIIDGASPADLHLLEGRLAEAAAAYRAQIYSTPDDLASWAGLVLAHRLSSNPVAPVLTTHPERVRAVHQEILERTGTPPDPEDLARWIASRAQQ